MNILYQREGEKKVKKKERKKKDSEGMNRRGRLGGKREREGEGGRWWSQSMPVRKGGKKGEGGRTYWLFFSPGVASVWLVAPPLLPRLLFPPPLPSSPLYNHERRRTPSTVYFTSSLAFSMWNPWLHTHSQFQPCIQINAFKLRYFTYTSQKKEEKKDLTEQSCSWKQGVTYVPKGHKIHY